MRDRINVKRREKREETDLDGMERSMSMSADNAGLTEDLI